MFRKIVILLLITAVNAEAQSIAEAPGLSSSHSEEQAVRRVRKQIEELNKAILHGAPQFSISGQVDAVKGETHIINGEVFIVNEETQVIGELRPGAYVEFRGKLEQGKPKLVKQAIVAERVAEERPQRDTRDKRSMPALKDLNSFSR